MKVYIVTDRTGIFHYHTEYHGIFLTEKEARAEAMNFDDPTIWVYDLDNPMQMDNGLLLANDARRLPEKF